MPEFDLRGMKVAKYNYDKTQKKISYDTPMSMGDAMSANLELKFAEGRLYAESALAEYMKKVTGLTVSQGVKYIPDATQKLLFKAYELSRSVGSGSPKTVKSMAYGKSSTGQYVGSGFYDRRRGEVHGDLRPQDAVRPAQQDAPDHGRADQLPDADDLRRSPSR